jgi:hypothetical protein
MNSTLVMSHFLTYILGILPEGCALYIGLDMDDALADGQFSKLDYFSTKELTYYDWYDYRIPLTSSSIKYLINEIAANPYLMNYLTHYAIVKDDKFLLKVFDSSLIGLLDTIKVPKKLIDECNSTPDIHIYLENPVT